MSAPVRLEKAELRQLDADFRNTINPENNARLQFNPESLKVSFANQIQTPPGTGDRSGTPARQFVGAGTTKLSLTVFFDANAPLAEGEAPVDDVRRLTQKIAYFITPQEEGKNFIPPAVRFIWGSFQFDGLMDSLEETLDFFSNDGKPLRASMNLSMSQQKITKFTFAGSGGGTGAAPPSPTGAGGAPTTPGTTPLLQASAGATVQGLAASAGLGDNWQAIATANGIENPRLLAPGQLINLNVDLSANAGVE
jgi:contractile injection system tube protein